MNWIKLKKIFSFLRKHLLAIILALSFLAPLYYSFAYKIEPVIDAQAYDKIAVNLMEGNGFREDANKSYQFDTAIIRAGPAYEFFLVGAYTVFGHRYEVIWILQAILHVISVYLLYLIGRAIFREKGETVGLLAAALFGLHPDLIEVSAMLMTETLYLFFIILAVWFFVKLYQEPHKLRYTILLSFVLAMAILSRPPVILFIPIILIYFLSNKSYKLGAAFLACLAIFLAPWIIRNYLIYHQFIITTLIGEYNLWVGNTLLANGGQISGGYNPLTSYTDVHGFFSLKQKASQEFWSFIFVYPLIFTKLCFIRMVRYFSLIRPMGFWFYQTGISQLIFIIFSGISIALIFISGFAGMLLSRLEKNPLIYYLIIFALTSPLVLIPTVVQSRYRFQIYPFLVLFGGYFLIALVNKFPQVKKILLVVILFLTLISLVDFYMFWPVVLDRIKVLI